MYRGLLGDADGKESVCNVGDPGSIPESGRSSGEGSGNPLQHSCLENPMDGGAWWATIHGVAKSQTRLSDFTSPLLETADEGGKKQQRCREWFAFQVTEKDKQNSVHWG